MDIKLFVGYNPIAVQRGNTTSLLGVFAVGSDADEFSYSFSFFDSYCVHMYIS